MARLAIIYDILNESNKNQLKQKRNKRRMMRYTDRAFSLNEDEFKANYGISKHLFEKIYEEISPYLPSTTRISDISPKYKILATLSFYATGSYQRLVEGIYGTLMSQQSVSRAIRDVTAALNHQLLVNKWIKFPQTRQERDCLKRRFLEKHQMPCVLGCVGCTHVAIIKPSENEEKFYNHKHFHSRNVMIISDPDLRILAVDASFGGASHDSIIWNQHPVKEKLINLNNNGENVYLLGDSGYAQREYMMTPITDAPAGSPEEYYTKLHNFTRNTVERTIAVLKNRWQCLLGLRVLHYHPDTAAKIITACCALHNMCVNKNIEVDLEDIADHGHDTPAFNSQESNNSTSAFELRHGVEKRAVLVQQLWASRS